MTSVSRPRWGSLLSGRSASEAALAARDIAEAIENHATAGRGPGVAQGAAGLALLNAYVAAALDDRIAEGRAVRWLERAVAGLKGAGMSLFGGAAGVAWVGEHIARLLGRAPVDPDEILDAELLTRLSSSAREGQFDLVSGLAGYGVFALERLPRTRARRALAEVVALLDGLAQRDINGISWFTGPNLLTSYERSWSPHGHFNLGVAHGVPGLIAVIARAAAAGVEAERSRTLASEAARWLLGNQLDRSSPSVLPVAIIPSKDSTPARAAWCYGDPGAAAALLVAARALRHPGLEAEAIALAHRAATRPPETSGVRELSLCHGAAGLAHLFNRMYQATGDVQLKSGAEYWLMRTLTMRDAIPGSFAGFHAGAEEREGMGEDGSGFLLGAAGVALVLLAASTDLEPAWDRLLLASPV